MTAEGRGRHIARLVVRRTAMGVPLLIAVSALVFVLAARSSFDPLSAYLGTRYQQASEAQKADMREQLGFDDSWWRSWLTWVGDVANGDLGWSRVYSAPVSQVFAERLPWTVLLSGTALLLAMIVAVVVGTAAGLRPGSLIDRCCTPLAVWRHPTHGDRQGEPRHRTVSRDPAVAGRRRGRITA